MSGDRQPVAEFSDGLCFLPGAVQSLPPNRFSRDNHCEEKCERSGFYSEGLVSAGFPVRMFFVTLPAFRQEVQTLIRFGTPSTTARTVWRFGFQRRLVKLWA